MIKNVAHREVSEIFSLDQSVRYVIPKYQREYTWKKEQWENLFDDLEDDDQGHFLGSIICINNKASALDKDTPMELVDGQQRLSTISILFSAIYENLSKSTPEVVVDDDFKVELINLKHRLIQKGSKPTLVKVELSLQNKNFNDYKVILQEIGILNNVPKSKNLGNRSIYKAYRFFKQKIRDLDQKDVLVLLDKLLRASMVIIEVGDDSDAFTLFESLNDRGCPLSPVDLIKNKMMAQLERKGVKSIGEAFDDWQLLLEGLPDTSDQERFLRQYFNAFKYKDTINVDGAPKATRSNIIKIYDRLIRRNAGDTLSDLIEKSKHYAMFLADTVNADYPGLADLRRVGAAPAYTFLLYLFSEFGNDSVLVNQVIEFLVKYFVRRNMTDFPNTRNLDAIFMELIVACNDHKNKVTFDLIKKKMMRPEIYSDDELFEKKMRGDIYEDNVGVARFVLCKIEEQYQTKESFRDLWQRDKSGKYYWTIEHIFPEGRNIPKSWVEMISEDGAIQEAKDLQVLYVHKLGNLTLTAYNSELSNYPFLKKRDRTDLGKRQIGYKNGLWLNKSLATKDSWIINDIQKRTDELVSKAISMFMIED